MKLQCEEESDPTDVLHTSQKGSQYLIIFLLQRVCSSKGRRHTQKSSMLSSVSDLYYWLGYVHKIDIQ